MIKIKLKKAISINKIALLSLCLLSLFCLNGCKKDILRIKITISSETADEFSYSDCDISPKRNTIAISLSEGLDECDIILKPVQAQQENAYEPIHIKHGETIKLNVEKGAWFKIGVSQKNNKDEDITICFIVANVNIRIE